MIKEPTRCSKCVLSAAFPRIDFDAAGVCNFCRDKAQFITEERRVQQAKDEIDDLVAAVKGQGPYDAVMCYSGGKDSTYTLIKAVNVYGLKVLAFTLDNGYISAKAFENISAVTSHLGIDHQIFKPSSVFIRDLVRISALHNVYPLPTLKRISSVCQSCISLVNISALRICLEKAIPLILSGFTLGQIPVNSIYYKVNYQFLEESRRKSIQILREAMGSQVDDYFTISKALLTQQKASPYQVNLLCLTNPSEDEIIQSIAKLGWKAPRDVDGCSSNCKLNMFNNFVHQAKYGFNPYELELSHLIRAGKMTRIQAMEKLASKGDPDAIQAIIRDLGLQSSDFGA